MKIDLEPRRLAASVGEPSVVVVTITNTGEVISGYAVRLLGADPAWVRVDDAEPTLFPGESAVVTVRMDLPVGLPAGERRMAVQVRELTAPEQTAVEEVVVDVAGSRRVEVRLDPSVVTGGRRGVFGVVIENSGNTMVGATLVGSDPERKITFTVDPPRFLLSPGEHTVGELRVTARRRLFGSPEPRAFELRVHEQKAPTRRRVDVMAGGAPAPPQRPTTADPGLDAVPEGTRPDAMGVFIQKPVFSRGLLAMLGLLLAVSIFAVVITTALHSVVSRSAADRDLALQVAQARDGGSLTGTSSLGGRVLLLSTGEGVEGVTVETFDEGDTAAPVATVATDEDGSFGLGSLPAGTYKLRFRAAGFDEVWYPAAATDADAEAVEVSAGQGLGDLTVLVGGVPASVSGTVVGDDVAGATVRLEMPLDTAPLLGQVGAEPGEATDTATSGAVVRSVPVGGDGTFDLTQVPSPGVYDLVTAKVGYSTQVQRIDVAAGESRSGVEIQLLDGDGSISGTVTGTAGPVGGASVVATFGDKQVSTESLTVDDVGSFTLRGLPTPGTFTVVVGADGFAPATLNLNLAAGQQLTGVSATLGAAAGTLSGTVTAPGDGGGVTVTVSDGATTRQTVTQSQGPVGSWAVSGLRIPSTYTVTFSRENLESQVLSISVDGFGGVTTGAPSASAVDVRMRLSTARLFGTVRQSDAGGVIVGPASNVQVVASSGQAQFVVTSASTPASSAGSFVLEGLPPGTYTLTFSRPGTRPTSSIVTLVAGQEQRVDPVLVSPASISGRVRQLQAPTVGAIVDLYRADQYGTAAPPVASVRTDGEGRYVLADVDAPASYILEVRYSASGAPVATSRPLTVQASDQVVNDFDLPGH
ncbi:carboxypeptidase-like regulatory domain-containing protein [Actinotalea sp. K2]|uniref:carboxypeptidase regulatory-like domain-containing protein n=1 Tax=Actinotalea sp. K2 TaxID=2939438 RepID=UPI00201809C8|nr:carboxypeptidase-like regulatory domain-containing protein [Actinotalea sp. K2]MCL3861864.1 carboxypeptidase regulatory-like domain-containing protein [Actinotalea sp. K2]